MLESDTREAYEEFIAESGRPDVIVLAGSNPRKPILGEACKALLPFPTLDGPPMVFHVSKALHDSDLFGKQIIVGPLERLSDKLMPLLRERGIDAEITQDAGPGDVRQMLRNVLIGQEYANPNSQYTAVVSSDFPTIRPEELVQIYGHLAARIIGDSVVSNEGQLYHALGRVDDDLMHYSGIRKRDRPGTLIDREVLVRPGSCNLARLSDGYAIDTSGIEELMGFRKVKEHVAGLKKLGNFLSAINRRVGVPGAYTAARAALNAWNMSGSLGTRLLMTPFPPHRRYFGVSMRELERGCTRATGIDMRFVVSVGSADIDNVVEYEAQMHFANGAKSP